MILDDLAAGLPYAKMLTRAGAAIIGRNTGNNSEIT